MSTATAERPKASTQLVLATPRLPYQLVVQEKFGIDDISWSALIDAIFPNATSVQSVILALSYCKARRLDVFKRNVHIVPIWSKAQNKLVDTIWPGIGELRTTAFRTGEYAGRDSTLFGDDIEQKIGTKEVTYPEWAQVTVHRLIKGQRVAFCGPQVYWIETYAVTKNDDPSPNQMWTDRPRGQLCKCAEAAALRAAFPEETGGDYIAEEVQTYSRGEVLEHKPTSIAEISKQIGEHSDPSSEALAERTQKMLDAFRDVGVSVAMLETKLGHPTSEITPSTLAMLGKTYKSIRDGKSKVAENFENQDSEPPLTLKEVADRMDACKSVTDVIDCQSWAIEQKDFSSTDHAAIRAMADRRKTAIRGNGEQKEGAK